MTNLKDILYDIECYFYRSYDAVRSFPKTVKHAYQRVVRGWDDTVWWGVSDHLSPMMVDVLTTLRDNHHGVPSVIADGKDIEVASEEWRGILNVMIDGFQASIEMDEFPSFEERKKLEKRLQKGLKMFSKYYMCLWD